mmetsp:Transcript_9668/g.20585  ORF Transcript_9668/g.20585 Transcript_9668/m.20585 type:complete len:382 (-) Transcript_9668:151-1296(-)
MATAARTTAVMATAARTVRNNDSDSRQSNARSQTDESSRGPPPAQWPLPTGMHPSSPSPPSSSSSSSRRRHTGLAPPTLRTLLDSLPPRDPLSESHAHSNSNRTQQRRNTTTAVAVAAGAKLLSREGLSSRKRNDRSETRLPKKVTFADDNLLTGVHHHHHHHDDKEEEEEEPPNASLLYYTKDERRELSRLNTRKAKIIKQFVKKRTKEEADETSSSDSPAASAFAAGDASSSSSSPSPPSPAPPPHPQRPHKIQQELIDLLTPPLPPPSRLPKDLLLHDLLGIEHMIASKKVSKAFASLKFNHCKEVLEAWRKETETKGLGGGGGSSRWNVDETWRSSRNMEEEMDRARERIREASLLLSSVSTYVALTRAAFVASLED